MSRIVVVGGGVAGLAVAARLARLRHDVTLLDGGAQPPDAPLLLTLPAALRDLFLKTGKPFEASVELGSPAVWERHTFEDGTTLDLPNGGDRAVAAEFGVALGERASEDWLRLCDHARRLWDAVRESFVESVAGDRLMRRLATHPRDMPLFLPGRSLRGLATGFLHDPRQRRVLASFALRHGSSAREASAALCLVPWVEQTFRTWQVSGGVRALYDALRTRALERGVDIVTAPADVDDPRAQAADVVVVDRGPGVASVTPAPPEGAARVRLEVTVRRRPEAPPLPSRLLLHDDTSVLSLTTGPVSDGGTGCTVSAVVPQGTDPAAVLDRVAAAGIQLGAAGPPTAVTTTAVVEIRLRPPRRHPRPGLFVVGDTALPHADVALAVLSAGTVADGVGRA